MPIASSGQEMILNHLDAVKLVKKKKKKEIKIPMHFEMEPTRFADRVNVMYRKKRNQEYNFLCKCLENSQHLVR